MTVQLSARSRLQARPLRTGRGVWSGAKSQTRTREVRAFPSRAGLESIPTHAKSKYGKGPYWLGLVPRRMGMRYPQFEKECGWPRHVGQHPEKFVLRLLGTAPPTSMTLPYLLYRALPPEIHVYTLAHGLQKYSDIKGPTEMCRWSRPGGFASIHALNGDGRWSWAR